MSATQIIHISVNSWHEALDDHGRLWVFEVDRYTGMPWPVKENGELHKKFPGSGHRFWQAYSRWRFFGRSDCS